MKKSKLKYNTLPAGLAVNIIGGPYHGRTGFIQAMAEGVPDITYLVAVTYERGAHLASTIHSIRGCHMVPVHEGQWTTAQRWLKYAFGITASHVSSTVNTKNLYTVAVIMEFLNPAFDVMYAGGEDEGGATYIVNVERGHVIFTDLQSDHWNIEIVDEAHINA